MRLASKSLFAASVLALIACAPSTAFAADTIKIGVSLKIN